MAGYEGNYSRGGDPAAMFVEENLYLGLLAQMGKAVVDADWNDDILSRIHQQRRVIQHSIGDGSPNNGFLIDQAASPANNFKITGGDGTPDGAGRLFAAGWPCMLLADVDYSGAYDARMTKVMPQVTLVAPTVLTDSTANWAVNEHAGKTLTPDIANPGTTFTILSNTATTITVTAGDLTTATAPQLFYRIELTTPSGADRTDRVYLDVFLDEQDENEDPNFVHAGLVPPQATFNRWILRQFVRVKEGLAAPAAHVDADGRQHYVYLIATLNRVDGVANVLAGQIDDERGTVGGGGSSLTVDETDGLPNVPNVTKLRFGPGVVTQTGPNEVTISGGGGGGASTGPASYMVPFAVDIAGVAAPTPIAISADIDGHRYLDGATNGHRFTWTVPEDYDSGVLELLVLYQMQTAVAAPNNQIRVATQAKIVDATTGAIDTASYPETQADLATPNNVLDFTRSVVLTIAAGDFNIGDQIQAYVKRIGAHANDLHTNGWDVIAYQWRYTAAVAVRAHTVPLSFPIDAAGEAACVAGQLGVDIDTDDFPPGSDTAHKHAFGVPENWDGITELLIRYSYAMSSAAASSFVRLETYGEIVDPVTGTITTIPVAYFDLEPPNDTDPHGTPILRSIPASLLNKGAFVSLIVARRVAVAGNHAGSFKSVSGRAVFGVVPASGFTTAALEEKYLDGPVFGGIGVSASGVYGDVDYPDLTAEFDALVGMRSTIAAGRLDCAFQGRLGVGQTQVTRIFVNVKRTGAGTPQYRLRVYVDGTVGPVYDSGITAAPAALTQLTLTDADLSAQPLTQKRYQVVMEMHCDAGEKLSFSRPFVRQE